MEEKCCVINNFEMNSPVYNLQGSQAESGTLLLLHIIIGVSVFLVYGVQCSVQGEAGEGRTCYLG